MSSTKLYPSFWRDSVCYQGCENIDANGLYNSCWGLPSVRNGALSRMGDDESSSNHWQSCFSFVSLVEEVSRMRYSSSLSVVAEKPNSFPPLLYYGTGRFKLGIESTPFKFHMHHARPKKCILYSRHVNMVGNSQVVSSRCLLAFRLCIP